ncbi:MAG: hypothetical protein QNJ98_00690 [Planctomycetota bacterium]|nr:hypothetical protein [Planctomycetota bacterium]
MKPLALVLLVAIVGAVGWWTFAHESEPVEPLDLPIPAREADDSSADSTAEPVRPAPIPGSAPIPQPVPPAEVPEVSEAAPSRPRLPLADKFIDRATWTDENAVIVLEQLAQAAGKELQLSRTMRRRLEQIRVTMDRGRTPVPKVLDLVLQPHIMSWYPTRNAIVVHDNDD